MGGISLGIFLVLQGASKPLVQFLPSIPPTTVNGNPTIIEVFKVGLHL